MRIFNMLFNKKEKTTTNTAVKNLPKNVQIALGYCGMIDKSELSRVLDRVTDPRYLELIAEKSTIDQARMWVAAKLENKEMANRVYGALRYSNDPLIRMAATQEYNEEKQHPAVESDQPAWQSDDINVAQDAVIHLTDQSLLIDIAKGKGPGWVQIPAERRLLEILDDQTEQAVLADIAMNFHYIPLRVKATEMLTVQAALVELATRRIMFEDKVNVAAIKRLTDKSVLIEIMNMTEGYMRNWRDDNDVPVHVDMRELARKRLSELA